jgi:glycosyltransferase involved in cell wall biosynthesis
VRIAYLISQYPAASHTFIRREIVALRQRGLDIQTFSVRRPLPEEIMAPVDRQEFENTWYVFSISPVALLQSHIVSFFQAPLSYLRTLVLAFRHRVPGLRALFYAIFYFAEAILLAQELKRRQIDHLHNHFAQAGAIVGFLASHYLKLKWSLTLHGLSDFDYEAGQLLNQKIAAAQFVACVSHFGRAQAMRLTSPIHWHKLFVSRCGIDMENLPVHLDQKTPEGRVRVLCVSRLATEKGLLGLIDALAMAINRGANLELRLIGEGSERTHIEQRLKEQGLQQRCLLLGRASEPEVFKEFTLADIFVLASFMEGLPVVLIEALALRVPVIAPSVAGIPELIESGQSGLLFSPANWEELAERLVQLSSDSQLRIRLATEGQRRVKSEFNIHHAIEPLLTKFLAGNF